MRNFVLIVLFFAAMMSGSPAFSQVKGEDACRKFLQEDLFRMLNEWSDAACGLSDSDVAAKKSAAAQAISIKNPEPAGDEISAACPDGSGWLDFFSRLADSRRPFHCSLLSASAICASRHGVWMKVAFEVKYDGKSLVAHDYMRIQTFPFGSVVDMVRASPPNDCEFEPAALFAVKGKVVDEYGEPVKGFAVTLSNQYAAKLPNEYVTYVNEAFSVADVAPFTSLSVSKPGYEPAEIPVSGRAENLIVKIKKLPMTMISVKGKVVDEVGNPLVGFSVSVADTLMQADDYSVSFKFNSFTIGDIPIDAVLQIAKPGYDPQLVPVQKRADIELVQLKKTPLKEISVSGRVLDEVGNPLQGFMVEVKDTTVEDYFITFRNETFSIGDIPIESVLVVTKPGYDTTEVPVNNRPEVGSIKLIKSPLTKISISGKVVDEIGNPVSDFQVSVSDHEGNPLPECKATVKKDNFFVPDVPVEGAFRVSKNGYEPADVQVSHRTDVRTIKLKKLPPEIIRVAGKVVDQIGNPVSGFTITISGAGEAPSAISIINSSFVIPEIPVDASFTVSKTGYEPAQVPVNASSEDRIVKIEKLPPSIINVAGKVADELGLPLSGFTVAIKDDEDPDPHNISIKSDGFTIGKASIDATLVIAKPGYETREVPVNAKASLGIIKLANAPAPASAIPGSFTETVNGVPFNMVFVSGGTFQMGGTAEQGSEASYLEKPAHEAQIGDFLIGQTEVTLRLWKAVMGSVPAGMAKFDTTSAGNSLPVVNVSWHDAQAFLARLRAASGKQYRLLSEAEWEYAARGGSMSKGFKYSGSQNVADVAWCDSNSGKRLHHVAAKQPNELGLYDMSGNAWEWCQDVYRDYDSESYTYKPGESETGDSRVYRGGGWSNEPAYCRVSYRHYLEPGYMNSSLGLRLAL